MVHLEHILGIYASVWFLLHTMGFNNTDHWDIFLPQAGNKIIPSIQNMHNRLRGNWLLWVALSYSTFTSSGAIFKKKLLSQWVNVQMQLSFLCYFIKGTGHRFFILSCDLPLILYLLQFSHYLLVIFEKRAMFFLIP